MAEIAVIASFIVGLKLTDIVYKSQNKMGKHDKTVRKTGKNKRTKGIPIFNQSANKISGEEGKSSFKVLEKTKFGGVPTRVPTPPILAE